MKYILAEQFGGPEVLRLHEGPEPVPGAGEAGVRVEYAGVNYMDIYQREGLSPARLPLTPGVEGAGIVERLASGASGVEPGQRVAWASHPGSYAEYATIPADKLVPVPDGIGARTAAAVMLQGLTAHYLSHSTYAVQPGDAVLVHAAGGGVGSMLVQMAKRRGARVIATVSTEEKASRARAVGADDVINYREADFVNETRRLTGGRGVHAVYDGVGAATWERSLRCLARRGCLVLYGQASGPVPSFDPKLLREGGSLFLTRPTIADYVATRAELLERSEEVFRWLKEAQLAVHVEQTFPLAEAAAAHRLLESRKTRGKLLLKP